MDAEGVSLLTLVLGAGAYAFRWMLQRDRAAAQRLDEEWARAARRLHGHASGASSEEGERTLSASVDGKVLVIQATSRFGANRNRQLVTRLRAGPLTGLPEMTMHVARRGILGAVARKLRFEEVATGDAAFDDAVRVTGSPAPLVRAFLDGPTCAWIREFDEPFEIEHRELTLERDGHPESAELLLAMASYAGHLVERWNALAAAPRKLAAELGLEPSVDGVVHARGLRRGREVTLHVRADDELAIVLTVDGGRTLELPCFEADADDVAAKLDALLATRGGYR